MNYFDLYSSYPDRTIAAAWDSQVKEANNAPWLAGTLTECGDELFARFAACYAELSALPRSARRALQRQLARSSELAAILPEYLNCGRQLQHRMAWSLAGAALLLALGQGVATAATITVTTNNPNVASDGQCSLVEAIVNANNDAATHPDCPGGSGADTIVLPTNGNLMLSNVYCRYTNTPFCNPVGLPPITSQITIEGNGATIHRQGGAPAFGLIAVRGNSAPPGVPPAPGDLTLQNVTLSGGSSLTGGGVFNSGTLSIKNSSISGNTAIFRGGGISNYRTLFIADSTISGNTTNFDGGGGIYNYSGSSGSVTIENSTISNNTANFAGGGIYNLSGRLTITNSTISGNRANRGGGVYNSLSTLEGPGTLTLNNSLIAGNQAVIASEIENFSRAIVNANNFNLFGVNGNAGVTGFTPGPTDIVPGVSLAQILGPLKNNGGPMQTHALLAGSPAIDAGDPGGCRNSQGALLQTDQRGFARHVDGNNDGVARCDIGAVELNRLDFPFTLVAAVLPSSRSVQVGNVATAFATIINAGQETAAGCAISPITSIPATLTYQTTNPATNQLTNSPNTPVDIPAGAAQSFVFALTPTAPMAPTDIQLSFDCTNTDPAPIIPGLDTLLFSASLTPVPDIVALAATLTNDGIVNIPGTNGTGVFVVATVNLGASGNLTVSADTEGVILPVNIFICQTDPQTGACFLPPEAASPRRSFLTRHPLLGFLWRPPEMFRLTQARIGSLCASKTVTMSRED